MAKHLAWSLLGIAELDPLNSIDHPSMTLSQLLYSLFLIMGVILLVNMMIALLSNTYQRVEVCACVHDLVFLTLLLNYDNLNDLIRIAYYTLSI